jgi:hypothetical protein
VELAKVIDGKKYMWDKGSYPTESEANEKIKKNNKEGFETQLIKDSGKYFVYSRRVVTEIVLEGDAPPG